MGLNHWGPGHGFRPRRRLLVNPGAVSGGWRVGAAGGGGAGGGGGGEGAERDFTV